MQYCVACASDLRAARIILAHMQEKKRQRLMRRAGKLSSADLTWLLARRVQSEQSEQMST